jgi:hypothetical protein
MCGRIAEIVRAWERLGLLSDGELALVSEHLGQCRRCACDYGALLPLLRRDAGRSSGLAACGKPLAEGFSDRLMERVGRTSPAGRAARTRRRFPRLPLAFAAGAALLAAGGFVAWFWGLRPGGEEVLMRFELPAPEARDVHLVGDFSDWDPRRLAMKDASGEGDWRITVRLKKGRAYTYNFLVDGKRWVADPGSPRQVDDGFGGTSTVLEP